MHQQKTRPTPVNYCLKLKEISMCDLRWSVESIIRQGCTILTFKNIFIEFETDNIIKTGFKEYDF